MKTSDWAIVFATLFGPILAVQAQKWIERWRERQNRKLWVFQTLMSTRAARLTSDHVRALNTIDIAFYGARRLWWNNRSSREQAVLDKWKEYLDDLSTPWPTEGETAHLVTRREDLFSRLLEAIGSDLRYRFDMVQLQKGGYFPQAHSTENVEQQRLRKLAIELIGGERSLKMDVERFPSDPAVAKAVLEVQQRLSDALDGKRALSVEVRDNPDLLR